MSDAPVDRHVPLDHHLALVLDTVRALLGEVDPARARATIGSDQSLTRDLALGSLERVELAMRLEQAAGVPLGETVLAEADTPRQIAAAISRAHAGPLPGLAPAEARPGPGLLPASARPDLVARPKRFRDARAPTQPRPGLGPTSSWRAPGLRPAWARPAPGLLPA